MKRKITKGATSVTCNIFIQDSSSFVGAGLTGLVFNSASLVCYYAREKAAATAVTLATQTVTGAWSSGGFVEISSTNMPGVYRLDVPDAAFATGVDSVVIMLKGATNMAPIVLEFPLIVFDLESASPDVNVKQISGDATAADNLESEYDGTGYLGDYMLRGTGSNASGTTIRLGGGSATDNYYNGCAVAIVSGTGAGQARLITAYDGSLTECTVSPAWTTTPTGSPVFVVLARGRADVEKVVGSTLLAPASGYLTVDLVRIGGVAQSATDLKDFADTGYDPAAHKVQGVVTTDTATAVTTVNGLAANVITAASIAVDAIGASELAADAVTEIQVGLATAAALTTLTNTVGTAGAGLTDLGGMSTTMKAQVETEAADAIVLHRLDELINADSDIDGAAPPTVGSVVHEMLTKTAGSFTYDQTTDSLEAVRDNMGTVQTGDSFARLGAPAGASVSADVAAVLAKWTTAMTEAYAVDGATMTPQQALYMLWSAISEFAIVSTTKTSKKLDGSTTAMTHTLDSATLATSITRAT